MGLGRGEARPSRVASRARDDQYNVTGLVDATGNVTVRYRYSDFGTPTITDDDGLHTYSVSAVDNDLCADRPNGCFHPLDGPLPKVPIRPFFLSRVWVRNPRSSVGTPRKNEVSPRC